MPELPEVETVRRALAVHLPGARLGAAEVRQARLRQPVAVATLRRLEGRHVAGVGRRGKYLLVDLAEGGGLVLHLGMSGGVLLTRADEPLDPHDHVVWDLSWPGRDRVRQLRFRDPRRFGLVLARSAAPPGAHPRLAGLGPEPLGPAFSVDHLRSASRGSRRPVKNLLLDGRVVAGVGNIYACEALHDARINPKIAAGRIGGARLERLRDAVRRVLARAIAAGGTTLSDFRGAQGEPGYFQIELGVYGRDGCPCPACGGPVRRIVQAGRSTYYCPACQH